MLQRFLFDEDVEHENGKCSSQNRTLEFNVFHSMTH